MTGSAGMNTSVWDPHALDTLKFNAGKGSRQALREAAQQMEGLFLQMMLKSMRDASIRDELMHSEATDMYSSMLDQQLAQNMAQQGQLGFAGMIVRQLSGENLLPALFTSAAPRDMASFAGKPVATATVNRAGVGLAGWQPFIQRLLHPVQRVAKSSGIHPHLILAQAALESGWGKREIPTHDGRPSHNLFAIKAGSGWQGKTTQITTTEVIGGVAQKVKAAFRVYDSDHDALADYIRLLKSNPRYQQVMQSRSAEQGAHALQAGGYATDPAYASKLIQIIQQLKEATSHRVQAFKTDLADIF